MAGSIVVSDTHPPNSLGTKVTPKTTLGGCVLHFRPQTPGRKAQLPGMIAPDVEPHAWLTQTLERIAQGWSISQIDALMPWNFKT